MKQNASEKFTSYKTAIESEQQKHEDISLGEDEFFLFELLAWYKNKFFQWVNQPNCQICNKNDSMKFLSNSEPNEVEYAGWAGNVEVYK